MIVSRKELRDARSCARDRESATAGQFGPAGRPRISISIRTGLGDACETRGSRLAFAVIWLISLFAANLLLRFIASCTVQKTICGGHKFSIRGLIPPIVP